MAGMRTAPLAIDPQLQYTRYLKGRAAHGERAAHVLDKVTRIVPVKLEEHEAVIDSQTEKLGPWHFAGWNFEKGREITWRESNDTGVFDKVNAWAVNFLAAVALLPQGAHWLTSVLEQQAPNPADGSRSLTAVGRAFGRERPEGDYTVASDQLATEYPPILKHLAWFLRDRAIGMTGMKILQDEDAPNDQIFQLMDRGRVRMPALLAIEFLCLPSVRLMGVTLNDFHVKDAEITFCSPGFLQYGGAYRYPFEELYTSPEMRPYLSATCDQALLKKAERRLANGFRKSSIEHGRYDNLHLSLNGTLHVWMEETWGGRETSMLSLDWNRLLLDQKIDSVLLTTAPDPY